MRTIVSFLMLIVLFGSCKKNTLSNDVPACVQAVIDAQKNNPNWETGSIEEYQYQGKLVYAFLPSKYIADGTTSIQTSDCSQLCTVGGYGGPDVVLCNGDNFFQHAVLVRTIWKQR